VSRPACAAFVLAGSGVGAKPLGLLNMLEVAVVSAGANGAEPTWRWLTDMEHEVGRKSGAIAAVGDEFSDTAETPLHPARLGRISS